MSSPLSQSLDAEADDTLLTEVNADGDDETVLDAPDAEVLLTDDPADIQLFLRTLVEATPIPSERLIPSVCDLFPQ